METAIDVTTLLVQDIEKEIKIVLEKEEYREVWGKSLKEMPLFTIR